MTFMFRTMMTTVAFQCDILQLPWTFDHRANNTAGVMCRQDQPHLAGWTTDTDLLQS